jgi:hypothetical protein
MPWAEDAACADHPEIQWVPAEGSNTALRAIEVCAAECPVRRECLAYALRWGRDCIGVWGGARTQDRNRYLPRDSTPLSPEGVEQAVAELEASLETRLRG